MVREQSAKIVKADADIRYAAKCGLCGHRFKIAPGPPRGGGSSASSFLQHWHDNNKCIARRTECSAEIYDTETIVRVFYEELPVPEDRERCVYLLKRNALIEVFDESLGKWSGYMNRGSETAHEWILRTVTNDTTNEKIDAETQRFNAMMGLLQKAGYVSDSDGAAPFPSTPSPGNSDDEVRRTGAGTSARLLRRLMG
jgi:hypothetical protein